MVHSGYSPSWEIAMNKPIQHQTFLRLIGVAIDPNRDGPELYYLLYEAEHDSPIMSDGRLVLFTRAEHSRSLAKQYAEKVPIDQFDLDQPFMLCDIADTLFYISEGGEDTTGTVLDTVNLLLDLVDAVSLPSVMGV